MTSWTEYSTQTQKTATLFSGQYIRNHWTLDIGVLGYIVIVWPKEHSPEVRSFPPGTPCIYIWRLYPVSCILKVTTRNMVVASDAFKSMYCVHKMNSASIVRPALYFVRTSTWQRHKQCSYGMTIFWGTYELIWLRNAINLLIYYFSSLCFLDLLRSSGNNTRVHVTAVKNWFLQHAGTQQVKCDLAFR